MNDEMINENDSRDKEEEKIYNYIGVIFENKNEHIFAYVFVLSINLSFCLFASVIYGYVPF